MSWENFERTSTILNNEDEVRYVVEESCIPLHNKKVLVVIVTFVIVWEHRNLGQL